MSTIESYRAQAEQALARMNEAAEATSKLPSSATDVQVAEAKRAFDAAELAYGQAQRAIDVLEARSALPAPARPTGDAPVTSEPLTYERGAGHSFFRDLHLAGRDPRANERLSRHVAELRVEAPRLIERNLRAMGVQEAQHEAKRYAEERALGSGSEASGAALAPPIWLQEAYAGVSRPGRATVDALGVKPLPAGTDTIKLPVMETGAKVDVQTADNALIANQDPTFGSRSAEVKTVAGFVDVSRQLVDRGTPDADAVVYGDLVADLDQRFDSLVLTSTIEDFTGLLGQAGTTAVSFTDADPTFPELYEKVVSAMASVAGGIFKPADLIIMSPRRYAWALAQRDSTGRAYLAPVAPSNAPGLAQRVAAESLVGTLAGLPVIIDPSVPVDLGAGANEDAVLVLRTGESFVWATPGGPTLEAFEGGSLSSTLTVRFRAFDYVAQAHGRKPKAIAKVVGTGLSAAL